MKAPDDGSLPIGGTTGLSHEHSAAVDEAAAWLCSRPRHQWPHPIVPELKKIFGLSAIGACEAIRQARDMGGGSHESRKG